MAEKETQNSHSQTPPKEIKRLTDREDRPVNMPITLPEAQTPATPPSEAARRRRRRSHDRQD